MASSVIVSGAMKASPSSPVFAAGGVVAASVQDGQQGIALRGRNSDGECAVGGFGEGCDDCSEDLFAGGVCGLVHAVVVEQNDVDSTCTCCPGCGGDGGGVENRCTEGIA